MALHAHQPCIGCTLLTCHRLRSRGSHSVHRSIYRSVHRSIQDHIHHSIHTRGQLRPWPQQQGQLQLQQTSCHRLRSRGSHSVHRSICRSIQDHVPRSIHDRIHRSIHTKGQLQPWPQLQGQLQLQPQQTSCRRLCRKGSHSSLHNDVQDRNSLHKEDKDQPLDRQLPLLRLQARPWRGRPSRE